MTPYDNILTKIGFFHDSSGKNNLSKRYKDDVITKIKNGHVSGHSIFNFSGDQKIAALTISTFENDNSPWVESFINVLHNSVFKTLDKPGSTPVIGSAVPPIPVFDTSSSQALLSINSVFSQLQIPTTGTEVPWVLSLAPLLGAIAPTPPPLVQISAILTTVGVSITPVVPVFPPTYFINQLSGFEFINERPSVPEFEFDIFLAELISVPYRVLSTFLTPTLLLVHNPVALRLQILESCHNEVVKLTSLLKLLAKPVKPTTLLASIVVWLENISAVLAIIVIGSLIGVGNIARNAASILGVI